MKSLTLFLSVALLVSPCLLAADDDHHHFDPSEKLGTVSFPVSCNASVQKPFERGVALLHSFAYPEAKQQFEEIAKQDPRCAMAYWGEAMSLYHELWSRPTAEDMKEGWKLVQQAQASRAKSQRERDYIGALAAFYQPEEPKYEKRTAGYAAGMKRVYEKYPQDHEAATFYALSLLASGNDDNSLQNARTAISILNKLFDAEPDHPGVAHYLIHACDNPKFAPEGLAAARKYAGIAASSPHAVHMPSHIFIRLGLWQDDIQSNLAAIEVARKISPTFHNQMHHRIHAMDFLEYAYLQIGDDAKAKAIVDELATFTQEEMDADFRPSLLNSMRLHFPILYALETRQWKDVFAIQPPADIPPYTKAQAYWAHAVAAGHLHEAAAARKAVEQFDAMLEATRKSDKPYLAESLKTDRDEAHAWLAFTEGKNEDALKLLRSVTADQDAVGKGEVELPAREMLADMLLDMGRAAEALAEYEKDLHTDLNRFNGLYGAAKAAELAREPQKASAYYAQLLKNCDNGMNSDRPELARAKEQLASGN